ncbi:MAG: DUF1772 domain-containing protein [Gemmatimonadaceae bacterium]
MILQLLATLCAAVFAGAAIYINIVEHPARMSLGPATALAEWRPAYRRGALMQAPLAIVGLLAGVAAWATGGDIAWLFGGVLLGAVVPFTLVVTAPTNKQLMDPATDRDPVRARALLDRWNRLHAVRSTLSLAALVIFLTLLG